MLDLSLTFDLERRHKERAQMLARDYQQGLKQQKAIVAFVRTQWNKLRKALNNLRRLMNSGPRTPELHY